MILKIIRCLFKKKRNYDYLDKYDLDIPESFDEFERKHPHVFNNLFWLQKPLFNDLKKISKKIIKNFSQKVINEKECFN